jgi:rod shape-determining protein MreD
MRLPAALGLKKAPAGRRVSPRGPVNSGLRGGAASRLITPWDWIFAPALMSFALTVVLATPFKLFGLYLPEPVSPLILAFVWPLIRPSFIAPPTLALLGLFLDAFWGAPMGFWTLNLMLVYGVLLMARSYIIGQDTVVVFGIFLLA